MAPWKLVLLCAAALCAAVNAAADPIAVSYSATGSAGNWTLDFNVSNDLTGAPDQALYFFGVALSDQDVVRSPAGYDPTLISTWTNSGLGGSNTLYNNVWIDVTASQLLPGSTLSRFDVQVSDLTVPSSVHWFAFTLGSTPYLGGGNFGDPFNPGFEGLANLVPEPGSVAWMAAMLGALWIGVRRRRSLERRRL